MHHDEDVRYRRAGAHAVAVVLRQCAATGRAFWGWTGWDWVKACGPSGEAFRAAQPLPTETTVRPFVIALGYLLGGFTDFQHLGNFNRLHLARLVFGPAAIEQTMSQAGTVLQRWGYLSQARDDGHYRLPGVLAQALLINRSPRLADLTTAAFAALHAHPATMGRYPAALHALQTMVADLGHCDPPVRPGFNHAPGIVGTHPDWAAWVQRWHDTSTLTPKVRAIVRTQMAKAGRWLAAEHPEITEPGQWTRSTCAAWVAAIDRMTVGDYTQRRDALAGRGGTPIAPRTKAHILMASRTFFRDCQEWEWIGRRFDPTRALAMPRSIAALIGTDPRIIADDVWAKLIWAGLQPAGPGPARHLSGQLLPAAADPSPRPDLVVLRTAQRRDRPAAGRLHPLAARRPAHRRRRQRRPRPRRRLPARRPGAQDRHRVHQAGRPAGRPGHRGLAGAAARPAQRLDRKTGERVDLLFSIRAHRSRRTTSTAR